MWPWQSRGVRVSTFRLHFAATGQISLSTSKNRDPGPNASNLITSVCTHHGRNVQRFIRFIKLCRGTVHFNKSQSSQNWMYVHKPDFPSLVMNGCRNALNDVFPHVNKPQVIRYGNESKAAAQIHKMCNYCVQHSVEKWRERMVFYFVSTEESCSFSHLICGASVFT